MRGHIRQRGNSWLLKVDAGKDGVTGKRRFVWKSVKGTQDDAEREMAKLLGQHYAHELVESNKLTVGAFLERWLSDYAAVNVAGKTYERYAGLIHSHLMPALGGVRLQVLRPAHVLHLYAEALKPGARKDGRPGGLSARSVGHIHRVLSEALKHAVQWQLIPKNPCDAVTPPRVRQREVKIIDEAKAAGLIEAAIGTRLYIPILLAVGAGLRRGEILAARWSCIDVGLGTLLIDRAVEQTKLGGVVFKEPKTRIRTVALPPLVLEALDQFRREQIATMKMLGDGYEDNGLICCQPHGAVWRPSAFTSSYCRLLARRGLTGPNFHALRHSHASHLLRAGIDLKEISTRLGHSSASFTLSTYAHVLPGQDHEAARRTDEFLRKAIDNQRKLVAMPKPAKAS